MLSVIWPQGTTMTFVNRLNVQFPAALLSLLPSSSGPDSEDPVQTREMINYKVPPRPKPRCPSSDQPHATDQKRKSPPLIGPVPISRAFPVAVLGTRSKPPRHIPTRALFLWDLLPSSTGRRSMGQVGHLVQP